MTLAGRRLRISHRDRRALVLGLRLAAPALLYAFIVKPNVASIRAANSRLESQTELLARERTLVAQAPTVPPLIDAARVAERVVRRRMYLEPDAVAATDVLSRDVARAFEGAGVSLQRVETRESSMRPDGLRELAIDIRADGDFEGILTLIASLETNNRLIRITRVSIDGGGSTHSGYATSATAESAGAGRLTMVATIRGYAP